MKKIALLPLSGSNNERRTAFERRKIQRRRESNWNLIGTLLLSLSLSLSLREQLSVTFQAYKRRTSIKTTARRQQQKPCL